jgi:hypothetical protein
VSENGPLLSLHLQLYQPVVKVRFCRGATLERGSVQSFVRRAKARFSSGWKSRPAAFAPTGSNRSSHGGNEAAEASGVEGHISDLASMRAVTRVNAEQASKDAMRKPTRQNSGEGSHRKGSERSEHLVVPPG